MQDNDRRWGERIRKQKERSRAVSYTLNLQCTRVKRDIINAEFASIMWDGKSYLFIYLGHSKMRIQESERRTRLQDAHPWARTWGVCWKNLVSCPAAKPETGFPLQVLCSAGQLAQCYAFFLKQKLGSYSSSRCYFLFTNIFGMQFWSTGVEQKLKKKKIRFL